MPTYKMIVMTKPVEGREKEYNDWYQGVHLHDLVAIDGIKAGQRFRLSRDLVPDPELLPYLAIYEIETDDIDGVLEELKSRAASGKVVVSAALSTQTVAAVYEELGPVINER
jgi:hypothetical protein